jgi:hypothetical protein
MEIPLRHSRWLAFAGRLDSAKMIPGPATAPESGRMSAQIIDFRLVWVGDWRRDAAEQSVVVLRQEALFDRVNDLIQGQHDAGGIVLEKLVAAGRALLDNFQASARRRLQECPQPVRSGHGRRAR